VPPGPTATTLKWYSLVGRRPLTVADTGSAASSSPGDGLHDAVEPYAVVGPYSNRHTDKGNPSGSTVPDRFAEVDDFTLAASVSATGMRANAPPALASR
jgi:hypothetical protein